MLAAGAFAGSRRAGMHAQVFPMTARPLTTALVGARVRTRPDAGARASCRGAVGRSRALIEESGLSAESFDALVSPEPSRDSARPRRSTAREKNAPRAIDCTSRSSAGATSARARSQRADAAAGVDRLRRGGHDDRPGREADGAAAARARCCSSTRPASTTSVRWASSASRVRGRSSTDRRGDLVVAAGAVGRLRGALLDELTERDPDHRRVQQVGCRAPDAEC
jgi:hypothetical protein